MKLVVDLPRDGADYHCTWAEGSKRCRVVTKKGLSAPAYDFIKPRAPEGVSFMRALCPVHLEMCVAVIEKYSLLYEDFIKGRRSR